MTNLDQAKKAVLKLAETSSIDYIVAPTEKGVLTGGFLRSYLGLPGLPFDQALYLSNKIAMKGRLSDRHIPVAPYLRLDKWQDLSTSGNKLGWPVVIKPAMGAGTMNTFRLDAPEDIEKLQAIKLKETFQHLGVPVLLEKYIHMRAEYHCDSVVSKGDIMFEAVSQYTNPVLGTLGSLFGSYVLPPDNPNVTSVIQMNRSVITAIGLQDGVTHLEVFHTDNGYVVGEIACSPGGGGVVKT